MAEVDLRGLGVALITPFRPDLSIDYECLESLIDHVIGGGADYIVALGTTAETPTLLIEERNILLRFIMEKVAGRVPLVAGVGGNCTQRVVKRLTTMDCEGYQAILSVTPFYNKPSQEGLYQHFKSICDNSPLPIVLYNVPSRTGVNLSAKTTLRLAHYSEKFCGIKEASGDTKQCQEILEGAPSNFQLISGDDSHITQLMSIGAGGVVSVLANAFPQEVKKLVNLCQSGDITKAFEEQERMMPLIKGIFEEGSPAGIKSLMSQMGLCRNILRLPLVPVSDYIHNKLEKERENFISDK